VRGPEGPDTGDWLLVAGWVLLVAVAFWALTAPWLTPAAPREAPVSVYAPRTPAPKPPLRRRYGAGVGPAVTTT
jgi:hypothetical protein